MLFENFGSLTLITASNQRELDWLNENLESETWQWTGDFLAVEPRLADAILEKWISDRNAHSGGG